MGSNPTADTFESWDVVVVVFLPQLAVSTCAAIAQLGERQTEDLEVLGSIPGLGSFLFERASSGNVIVAS